MRRSAAAAALFSHGSQKTDTIKPHDKWPLAKCTPACARPYQPGFTGNNASIKFTNSCGCDRLAAAAPATFGVIGKQFSHPERADDKKEVRRGSHSERVKDGLGAMELN